MSQASDIIAKSNRSHRRVDGYNDIYRQVIYCECCDLVEYTHDTHEAHQADAAIAALTAAGMELVKLPKTPSEYWGPLHQPQWNRYPFTRVDGDEIEIGARSEGVYRINILEARGFAADLVAAAKVVEDLRCVGCGEVNRPGCPTGECSR